MALLINKNDLKKGDGSNLPSSNVLVKFIYQSDFDGFNQKFILRYYDSLSAKNEGFSDIKILFNNENNELTQLDNQFIKELSIDDIIFYEGVVNNILPNETCSTKTIFTFHLFIKDFLESFLGQNTVEIRLDIN